MLNTLLKWLCPHCGMVGLNGTPRLCDECFHLMVEISDQTYYRIIRDRAVALEYRQRNGKIR